MKLSTEEIKTLALEYVKSRPDFSKKTPEEILNLYVESVNELEKLKGKPRMQTLEGGI